MQRSKPNNYEEKKKIVRLYCGFQVFFDLLLWLPVFYAYQSRFGLSDGDIVFIQSLHYFSFFVFEIPTGYLADRFGYRNSMRWGAGIFAAANLLAIAAPMYAGFLAHFLLVALSRSLISGAANAYLYEYLKHFGAKDEYKTIEGRARGLNLVAKVVGWAGVGALMDWHVTLPYWATFAAALVALSLAQQMPVLPAELRLSRLGRRRAALAGSGEVLHGLVKSPVLALLMLLGLGAFVLGRVQVTFFQPVLAEKGFALASFGWLMSLMTLFEALGSFKPEWVQKRFNDLHSTTVLGVMLAVSFLVIALAGKNGTLAGFCLFSYAIGLAYPIQKQLLNDAITDSAHRATLLSIESMFGRAASAGVIAAFSGAAAPDSASAILSVSALGAAALTITAFLGLRHLHAPAVSATPAN